MFAVLADDRLPVVNAAPPADPGPGPQQPNAPNPPTAGTPLPAAQPSADTGNTPEPSPGAAPLRPPARRRRLTRPTATPACSLTPPQRLLLLDAWRRSGLPAGDFAPLVGVSKPTLDAWKRKFDQEGPAGLEDRPRGSPAGSRLPEVTRRAILMMKEANPDWGVEKSSALLLRGPALAASPRAVARVLHEAGYETEEAPTKPHPDHPRSFERVRPNQLWQTDMFTFMLKRQNRRLYMVAFRDDHSRFLVSSGLHASQSAALLLEVFRAALAGYGAPEEVLTDNGSQYVRRATA
jgi:transposase InsO family protein